MPKTTARRPPATSRFCKRAPVLIAYVLGMGIAIAIGGALGQSLVAEHGRRKVLPALIVLTILCGLAIGWGLNGEINAIRASSQAQ